MIQRLRALDLCHQRNGRGSRVDENLPRLRHIAGAAHKTQCDHVDSEMRAEPQVFDVFRRQRVR